MIAKGAMKLMMLFFPFVKEFRSRKIFYIRGDVKIMCVNIIITTHYNKIKNDVKKGAMRFKFRQR